MKSNNFIFTKKLILIILFNPIYLYAASCESYPYDDGLQEDSTSSGIKITSTSSVAVKFNDIDAIKDYRLEAELNAKAAISEFLNSSIYSEESITREVNKSKSLTDSSKSVSRGELSKQLTQVSSKSSQLLKGIKKLGDCYTKSKEIRVTVGILLENTQ